MLFGIVSDAEYLWRLPVLFLLHIQTQPRPDLIPAQRAAETQRESAAAVELMRRGLLRRIFRAAGSNVSYCICEAASLEDLDATLRSMPAFSSILHVTVTPLIKHPVEEAYEREHGSVPHL